MEMSTYQHKICITTQNEEIHLVQDSPLHGI